MPRGISSLAVELIQEIALYVPLCDGNSPVSNPPSTSSLISLRLVSRQFKHAVDPYALSKIKINFGGVPMRVVCDRLSGLASGNLRSVTRFAKVLSVRGLEPDCSEEDERGFAYRQIANGRLGNLLVQAVKSFRNLHALYWDITSTFLMYSFLDGLFHLSNIEELSLKFSLPGGCQRPEMFPLRRFSHLRSLTLASISNLSFYLDLVKQLTESVGRTPDLTHLDIGLSPDNTIFANLDCVLHTLVQNAVSVTKARPLKLQHLRVHGVTLHIDSVTLPHLRQLSTLNLSWLPGRDNARIWTNLLAASIHLTSISVDRICGSLLDYLASYAGLKHFSLVPPEKRVPSVIMGEYSLQTRFFERILPMHKYSLRKLRLGRKPHPREWRLTVDHFAWLSVCQSIDELALSIYFEELRNEDFLRSVILMSFNNLPNLQTLKINYAKDETCPSIPDRRTRLQTIHLLDSIILELDVVRDFGRATNPHYFEIVSQDVRYWRDTGALDGHAGRRVARLQKVEADWVRQPQIPERWVYRERVDA